jgi:hypothetical protein
MILFNSIPNGVSKHSFLRFSKPSIEKPSCWILFQKKESGFDKIRNNRIWPPPVSQPSNVFKITFKNPTRVKKPGFEERLSRYENGVNFSNNDRTPLQR